jgi:hypothetical protein
MNIIVKKEASHSLFRPHMNQAMGKFYRTKSEYLGDMKKMGLEPFKGVVKRETPKRYEGVSVEARKMMNSVTYGRDGKPNVGDRYYDKLKEMGMKKVPKELIGKQSGGFYGR